MFPNKQKEVWLNLLNKYDLTAINFHFLLFARFGATPKVLIASVVGYFLGKVSYMDTCREKFLTQVPNSNISIAIRKARGEEVFYEVTSWPWFISKK